MRVYVTSSADTIRRNDVIVALRMTGHACFTHPDIDILRQADAAVFVHPTDETALFEYGVAIGSRRRIIVLLEHEHDRTLRLLFLRRIERTCLTVDEVVNALAPPLNDPPDEGGDPLDLPIDHAPEEE